jgi:chromosome segregation ATPase
MSVNMIAELESKKDTIERDSHQLREEYAALQDALTNVQQQLDSSAMEIAKLEQLRSRDKFNEGQLKESLKAAKARIHEQSEEKRLLTDMWDREREDTLERLRSLIADKESHALLQTAENEALAMKVRLDSIGEQVLLAHN